MKKFFLATLVSFSLLITITNAKQVNIKGFADIQVDMTYSTNGLQEKDRTFGVLPQKDDEEFQLHIKNSKLGLKGTKIYDDGGILFGYISNYYYGRINNVYGTTTGPIPRAYCAFISYSKNGKTYTLGQAGDIFSPLAPTGSNPSAYLAINTGYLRPMISLKNKLSNGNTFEWALAQPVSFQTNVAIGDIEAQSHKVPFPDVQIRYSLSSGVGISAVIGKRKDPTNKYFDTQGFCIDFNKKNNNGTLKAEIFTGQAISGYFGGMATVDIIGVNEIKSDGYWINYVKQLNKTNILSITIGTQENEDKYLAPTLPLKNELIFLSYEKQLFHSDIKMIHELSYHNSEYKGLGEFDAIRASLSWKTSF